jgi:hypothetical protein
MMTNKLRIVRLLDEGVKDGLACYGLDVTDETGNRLTHRTAWGLVAMNETANELIESYYVGEIEDRGERIFVNVDYRPPANHEEQ